MKKLLSIVLACALFGIAMSCSDDDEQPIVRFDSSVVSPAEDFVDPRDQQVYPCVRIGNQIWMTRNLCYQMPCNSLKGCFTWNETYPNMERVNVWPDYSPSNELFIAVVTEVANDPQYEGWSGMGAYLPASISFSLNGMPDWGVKGTPQEELVAKLKKGELLGDPDIEPDFIEAVEERMKETEEYHPIYGRLHFQKQEDENNHYSEKYGLLYSYNAALAAVPEGWRLPSDEDWMTLETTLGMDPAEAELFDTWRGKGMATLMNKNGESGLNLQRGGANVYVEANEEKYLNKDETGYYWSSTKYQENDSTEVAVFRMSAFYSDKIWRGSSRISTGMRDVLYSVRCVKDVQ